MAIISPPQHEYRHPERAVECEGAAQPAFQLIIRKGVEAGWTEQEMAMAVLRLARNELDRLDRQVTAETSIQAANTSAV